VYYYQPSDEFNKTFRSEGDYAQRAKLSEALALENDILKVLFDEKGNIVSIFDKRTNKETLANASRTIIIDENEHDTWSHGKNYFDKEIGAFECTLAEKLESNAIRETVKVCASYGDSELTQYYTLHAGEDFVRVKVKLNWNEKHKMLKFAFPVKANTPTSIYEIPFGSVERPGNGEEESALMWAMVGDENIGLAILNDRKYSYSAKDNQLALTALRSPIYCDHSRKRSSDSNYTDQGEHEFYYALLPATTQQKARIFKKALAFNTLPTVILENHHEGKLPLTYSGLAVSAENIVISALKKSEDGMGYVLRAYECAGVETSAVIDCKDLAKVETTFSPYEIKTFFIHKNKQVEEVLFTEYKE
jgi:alpha-mannosidase